MYSDCLFEDLPTRLTMTVRTRTSVENLPATIGNAYAAIMQYLGESGGQPSGMPFVIYYNLDIRDLDVEIGFPVTRRLPEKGDVRPGEIPGMKAATSLYTGPYPEMGPAYEALNKCIADNGYEAAGMAIEEYLNSPMDTPPERLQTRIILPLREK